MYEQGKPTSSSILSTYLFAAAGSLSYDRTPVISSFHPGKVSYSTWFNQNHTYELKEYNIGGILTSQDIT